MSDKIEGTFFLDGLIEGRLPILPKSEEKLREWVRSAGREHLKFSLDIDGGNFSLLPSTNPVSADSLLEPVCHTVQHALEKMLEFIPLPERPAVQSTLRSTEYRENLEVQTLYLIASDGTVQARTRNVGAKTTPPPKPLTRREKIKLAVFSLVLLLAMVGISAIFIDYRALYHDLVEQITPLDTTTIEVRTDGYEGLLQVTKLAYDSKQKALVLMIQRDPACPADLAAACAAEASVPRRLALEALLRGYAHAELFDEKGKCIGFSFVRIAPLRTTEQTEIGIPLPREGRPVKLVIGF